MGAEGHLTKIEAGHWLSSYFFYYCKCCVCLKLIQKLLKKDFRDPKNSSSFHFVLIIKLYEK